MKAAIIGASGFTGEELAKILLGHREVEITYLSAKLEKELPFSELFPSFKGRLELVCKSLDLEEACGLAEVIFLALPHKISQEVVPQFLAKNKIVIDLSADYRFKDSKVYEKYYKIAHTDSDNLQKAVYGLPEFYAQEIKKTKLVANPGCYPTVSALSLAPLLKENIIQDVIIDAKSGITGAGRRAALEYHYAHLNGNLFCYKPFEHQHLPEINQTLSDIAKRAVSVRFTPHVIPVERGIIITVYSQTTKDISIDEINSIYENYYKEAPFVRFFKQKLPQLKDVVGTNFCDIGIMQSGKNIVIVGTIDNLVKGASGQAVQNMNLIMGWDETLGLL